MLRHCLLPAPDLRPTHGRDLPGGYEVVERLPSLTGTGVGKTLVPSRKAMPKKAAVKDCIESNNNYANSENSLFSLFTKPAGSSNFPPSASNACSNKMFVHSSNLVSSCSSRNFKTNLCLGFNSNIGL